MDKVITPDVLTLEQASNYLQLSTEIVLNQAIEGRIPSRKIGNDWRFLKSAIDEWLSAKSSSSILLSQAGAFADDDSLDRLRSSIYESRERPEIDVNSGTNL